MPDKPSWLPEMISVEGEPKAIFETLYRIFSKDFKETRRTYKTYPVWHDRRIIDGKYEEGFWHLISRDDKKTKERLFDPRRAERLPWCGPTISHSSDAFIKAWNYYEGKGGISTYIWIEDLNYVIILKPREQRVGKVYFLKTAYYIDGDRKKNQLQKKYGRRIQ